jgi:hypothetical protein
MGHPAADTSGPVSIRPIWTRNSFVDDLRRARSRWTHAAPIGFGVTDFPRWRAAVVDRYAGLALPNAYVPLTANWMHAYLDRPEVRTTLERIAAAGSNAALIASLIGFCAEHQAYFDREGRALRTLFQEVIALQDRRRIAQEIAWAATQLQVLADRGLVGFANGWLRLRRRLPKTASRPRRGEAVVFAELLPELKGLAAFLGAQTLGWADLPDLRFLLSGKRGARNLSVLDECIAQVTALLRQTRITERDLYGYTATLLGPAFVHLSSKAVYMRLRRRAERGRRAPERV